MLARDFVPVHRTGDNPLCLFRMGGRPGVAYRRRRLLDVFRGRKRVGRLLVRGGDSGRLLFRSGPRTALHIGYGRAGASLKRNELHIDPIPGAGMLFRGKPQDTRQRRMQEKHRCKARPCFAVREDGEFRGSVSHHCQVKRIVRKRKIELSFFDSRVNRDLQSAVGLAAAQKGPGHNTTFRSNRVAREFGRKKSRENPFPPSGGMKAFAACQFIRRSEKISRTLCCEKQLLFWPCGSRLRGVGVRQLKRLII